MDRDMEAIKVCLLLLLLLCKCNKIVSLLRCATKKKVIVVARPAGCCSCCTTAATVADSTTAAAAGCSWNLLLAVCILTMWPNVAQLCHGAPSTTAAAATVAAAAAAAATNETAWPPMRYYDIWNADLKEPTAEQQLEMEFDLVEEEELPAHEQLLLQNSHRHIFNWNGNSNSINNGNRNINNSSSSNSNNRRPKVIHLFPVPVDGECLSDDGRRLGNCFNAYECHQKGGQAKGECAMGFGVCCVFVATCNGTITNNITYIVSPDFPSFMPNNFTGCQVKVKMMSEEISQLRIDFYHFSLGQPNRRSGVCDGDVFNISGGPAGPFLLCGQNSGQHLYYDVGVRALPRQSTLYGSLRPPIPGNGSNLNGSNNGEQVIDINLNLSTRFLPIRLWEMRVAQIPFSQRAPAGCLQYHTGLEGVLQTFNFADNGRHLANQHYRICVRQETDMCSIIYQPCDEQSFRIGGGGGGGSFMSLAPAGSNGGGSNNVLGSEGSASTAGGQAQTAFSMTTGSINTPTSNPTSTPMAAQLQSGNTSTAATVAATTSSSMSSSNTSNSTPAMTTPMPLRSSTAAAQEESTSAAAADDDAISSSVAPVNDDVEGSGGAEDDGIFNFFGGGGSTTPQPGVSRRPRPVGGGTTTGGFDLLGFLRSAFDLRLRHRRRRRMRDARQFFSTCTDRITMPCIIEDFIGTGLGPLPGCEPVHCGAQFCSSGVWPCRIESTVTPFYIGVHFGDGGSAGKGSAEDNIGACLRYAQVQCV